MKRRIVPLRLLEALAAEAPDDAKGKDNAKAGATANGASTGTGRRLKVEEWLTERGVAYTVKEEQGRTVYKLAECPFDPAHGKDSAIFQDADGRLGAKCFHAGCAGNGWRAFRECFGKPGPEHYDGPDDCGFRFFGSGPVPGTETETGAPSPLAPKLCSELCHQSNAGRWLWEGFIARDSATLFSALWKAGKTTLLAYLLRAMHSGCEFCGRDVGRGTVLYVTEEAEGLWADRRDELGLGDNVRFIVRPFRTKPTPAEWVAFIGQLAALQEKQRADLIVLDTLSNLWPVRNENDAGEVSAALMPLHALTTGGTGLLLVHHLRKGDGKEATGTRGSGALPAWPDTLLELRRFDADSKTDRRRVLTGYGRWEETPEELVLTLALDGSGYRAEGDRHHVQADDARAAILSVLPVTARGMAPQRKTTEEIFEELPDPRPTRKRFLELLRQGAEGDPPAWVREGSGKRGDPYTYRRPEFATSEKVFPPENENAPKTESRDIIPMRPQGVTSNGPDSVFDFPSRAGTETETPPDTTPECVADVSAYLRDHGGKVPLRELVERMGYVEYAHGEDDVMAALRVIAADTYTVSKPRGTYDPEDGEEHVEEIAMVSLRDYEPPPDDDDEGGEDYWDED